MIKAIIFDFDGLILDTEYPEYLSWKDVFEGFGLELPIRSWANVVGRGASTISTTPYDDLEQQLGHPIDRSATRAARRDRFSELMKEEAMLPGVQSLLDEARSECVLVGLASSSPRTWVHNYIEQLGIDDRFDAITCGDEVVNAKPYPDVYPAVLNTLKIRAEEAVALEDSPNGISAANAAGIYCIAVPNALTRHTSLAHANATADSLEKLSVATIAQMVAA
jgi:HAD superfamily hydrolase (TIGR01509 family)